MASSINADNGVSSGSAGLKSSADSSGVLALQTNGTTAITVGTDQSILMTGAPSIGGAGYGMGMGFRNRIINGAMVIDQRNAGGVYNTTTLASVDFYSLDRWIVTGTQNSKFTLQGTPSTTETGYATRVNAGFLNYLACTSSSAYSVGSGDLFAIGQFVEGFNTSDLAWGTSNAKSITVSFWVYSSLTGTFGGAAKNGASNRSYPFTYTISTANTWEQKSITIAGDTSGTWVGATNGVGLRLYFSLGSGSTYSGTSGAWAGANYFSATGAVSVVGTNGATFYITGVQLEKGATATSFDYRPYGTELALCQRYYWQLSSSDKGGYINGIIYQGWADTATSSIGIAQFPVTMRTSPTLSTSGTVADYVFRAPQSQGTSPVCNAVPTLGSSGTNYVRIGATTSSTFTIGAGHYFSFSGNTTGYIGFSSEL